MALGNEGTVIFKKDVIENANHASMLAVMIDELMKESNIQFGNLDAIGISAGPGSYTGLRIGASTAKGLCFVLEKPLIAIDSLEAFAFGMSHKYKSSNCLYVPVIDARRDEIYYGIFGDGGEVIQSSRNAIADHNFLLPHNENKTIVLGGTGALKCHKILTESDLLIDDTTISSAQWMTAIAENLWKRKKFSDPLSFEPNYIKPAFVTKLSIKE